MFVRSVLDVDVDRVVVPIHNDINFCQYTLRLMITHESQYPSVYLTAVSQYYC